MKNNNKKKSIEELFQEGVNEAIERNKKNGVPSVFAVAGKPIFLMPDGSLRTEFDWSVLEKKRKEKEDKK